MMKFEFMVSLFVAGLLLGSAMLATVMFFCVDKPRTFREASLTLLVLMVLLSQWLIYAGRGL